MIFWNWARGALQSLRSARRLTGRRKHARCRAIEICEARILPAIVVQNDTITTCSHGYYAETDVGLNDSHYSDSYEIYEQGELGTASIDNNGILRYDAGETLGTDTVKYRAWDFDQQCWSDVATVTINVTKNVSSNWLIA